MSTVLCGEISLNAHCSSGCHERPIFPKMYGSFGCCLLWSLDVSCQLVWPCNFAFTGKEWCRDLCAQSFCLSKKPHRCYIPSHKSSIIINMFSPNWLDSVVEREVSDGHSSCEGSIANVEVNSGWWESMSGVWRSLKTGVCPWQISNAARALDPCFPLYKSASSVIAHFSMPPVRTRQVIAVALTWFPLFIGIYWLRIMVRKSSSGPD